MTREEKIDWAVRMMPRVMLGAVLVHSPDRDEIKYCISCQYLFEKIREKFRAIEAATR